jgi:PIN domain nuclease of toxin-antitoxin system
MIMDYVSDTHSIVWYFTEDPRLSESAMKVFDGTVTEGVIIVPSVVLAEIMFICRKGRITLTFEESLRRIEEYENFQIASLDVDILRIADKIQVDMEMHDRLIVATALHFEATLITKDHLLRHAQVCPTLW